MSDRIPAALSSALDARRPGPGLIHHSDRGATYTAGVYQDALREAGITQSMSRKANCWSKAVVESFFASLKREIGVRVWPGRAAAGLDVFSWIEGFYNPRRLHSARGYRSPEGFEQEHSERLEGSLL